MTGVQTCALPIYVIANGSNLGFFAPALLVGVLAAFASGLVAIRLLLLLLDGRSTRPFIAYRFAFAAILIGTAIARGGA